MTSSSTQSGKRRPHSATPQTNLSIGPLSQLSAISPVAQTYDDDSPPIDEEHLIIPRENSQSRNFQGSTCLLENRIRAQDEDDSNDTLSPIDENDDNFNNEIVSITTNATYPEDLNPFASRKNKIFLSKSSNQKFGQVNRSFDGGYPPELEYSFNSTGNFSSKSMPVMMSHGKHLTGGVSGPWNNSVYLDNGGGGSAAEIAKSRYALQNKKLLEELEHRT